MTDIVWKNNTSSAADIVFHFQKCNVEFVSQLSVRVDLQEYVEKLATKSFRHEAWVGADLAGLLAVYYNDDTGDDFITDVSVADKYLKLGIASRLLSDCIAKAKSAGHKQIRLEVSKDNTAALALYDKHGFVVENRDDKSPYLSLKLLF